MATRQNVIAIVDDDPGIRDALECLLWAFGYRTESYTSAEEFISATAVTKASCLLVDMQLGETSGLELCRHLSATGFTFPIIFITGLRDETLRKQAMNFGCVAYLLKPFSADRLTEAITKAIGGNS